MTKYVVGCVYKAKMTSKFGFMEYPKTKVFGFDFSVEKIKQNVYICGQGYWDVFGVYTYTF
ncbi:hypothetical protein HCG49_16350 [Arenibacter sp. 6A1]|uniref:hypothetical protein n=1 Tax=Arenibacter sp. 6A1 TaxID=2720391 RepID=UPI001448164B|nr:hypothetical protein [Arenibacter sp. 6A1]NKI28130.1 hypothetical protein [Arenibacter sp. 6A1]